MTSSDFELYAGPKKDGESGFIGNTFDSVLQFIRFDGHLDRHTSWSLFAHTGIGVANKAFSSKRHKIVDQDMVPLWGELFATKGVMKVKERKIFF